MTRPDDVPVWAWEKASGIYEALSVHDWEADRRDEDIGEIAFHLMAERERAAWIADRVANDSGERAARGYKTEWERAQNYAGRNIARAIMDDGNG